jgi:hypothetical protein
MCCNYISRIQRLEKRGELLVPGGKGVLDEGEEPVKAGVRLILLCHTQTPRL